MKVEVNSFTPNSNNVTIFLDDDTIQIKGIIFLNDKNSSSYIYDSIGFSDGTRNRAKSVLGQSSKRDTKRSTSRAITHYEDVSGVTTLVQEGYVTDISTPGEFEMSFPNYNATPVDFMVFGY